MVQLSGVRYRTIKYYTEEGLVPFEQEDILE
ncbi:MerR family transcriptional regulator [Peribacillus frigoritolerans]